MRVFFVTKRLAFGSSIRTERDIERLRELGITHLLNLRRTKRQMFRQLPNLQLGFKDNKKPRPFRFYSSAVRFYRKAMNEGGAKLFVMCHHGLCRSPSLVYFLLRCSGLKKRKAKAVVQRARASARIVQAYEDSCDTFLQQVVASPLESQRLRTSRVDGF